MTQMVKGNVKFKSTEKLYGPLENNSKAEKFLLIHIALSLLFFY